MPKNKVSMRINLEKGTSISKKLLFVEVSFSRLIFVFLLKIHLQGKRRKRKTERRKERKKKKKEVHKY